MRLLFLIHALSGGGAERLTAAATNQWAARGWDVTVVTLAAVPDAYALSPSVRRIQLELSSPGGHPIAGVRNWTRRVRAVRRLLRQVQPDIAIGVMSSAMSLIALAAYGLREIVTIGWEHTHPSRVDPKSVHGRMRHWTYGLLDTVVALTPEAGDWLAARTRVRSVVVIPNPVLFPLPALAPVVTPGSVLSDEARVLLSVGRFDPVKRFDRLIDAFQLLAGKHPDWRLVILGDGPERPALESQVATLGLHSRVLLPGRAGNVADWYERASVYALSSDFEGLPCTLMEALSYGLPVVSVDCESGPRNIVRDGVDGVLVRPNDPVALAEVLDRVMGDDALRRALAMRAPEVRARFAPEQIADNWEKLFGEVRRERH